MKNIYMPWKTRVMSIEDQPCATKVFRIKSPMNFSYEPGQFVEVSIPGIGEAPISLASNPTERGYIDLCIRVAGNVTQAIHRLNSGDPVWIRGPYGVGFPYETIKGKDIVYVAGGIGMAPLHSSINYVLANKQEFGKVTILYGAKTPSELLYKSEFEKWARGAHFLTSVDSPSNPNGTQSTWTGNVGVVTTLFDKIDYPIKDAVGIICGPPVMYKFVIRRFKGAGMEDRSIYISLERLMKCGVGKCQHCQIDHKYVCMDGPVFNYAEATGLPEAI